MYAYIRNNIIESVSTALPPVWKDPDTGVGVSNFHLLAELELNLYGWYTMNVIDPPYDSDTQFREEPIDTWDGTTATRTYTIRDKTQEELDADQIIIDERMIQRSIILIGSLTVQLIDKLLVDNVISATDFTEQVRTDYITLKNAVDRISN